MQMPELARSLHPRFIRRLRGSQLFLHGFGHELAQGNPALSGLGFGLAKYRVRDFQGGLRKTVFPYLRDRAKTAVQACQTILPLTMVATGPPRNDTPSNGELRLLESDLFTS